MNTKKKNAGVVAAVMPAACDPAQGKPAGSSHASIATAGLQPIENLAQWQVEVAIARAALLDECTRVAVEQQVSIACAEEIVVQRAKRELLPADLREAALRANAKRGADRTLSTKRISEWRRSAAVACTPSERIRLLAPKGRGKKWGLDQDVAAVLAMYRRPNKPALRWCVLQIAGESGGPAFTSLYERSRRQLKKLPKPIFYPGRHTGAALKALSPFRRREFLSLAPNDVWTGDGHSAKLRIAHPDTGNPFVPEVTVIMDVATRYIVGWSVSLSENCLAVSDALRHAVSRHGIPLIYYSDNGSGQTAKMLDAPVTGILAGLGIHHETGIPGNAQGRGVIERSWQTVTIPLAKRFSTYQGRGADRDSLRAVTRSIERDLRAARNGEVSALPRRLPSWHEFLEALELEIEAYNVGHHHRSLPKLDGSRHATPAEYRAHRLVGAEPPAPQPAELAALFMPSVERIATRGEVKLWNGIYYHADLMLVDREPVRVCYDIHDSSYVLVRKLSGEFIARAELAGNSSAYFPKPFIERLREERAQRRLARLEDKAEAVRAELNVRTQYVAPERSAEELAELERFEHELAAPATVNVLALRSDADKHDHWMALDARRAAGEALGADDEAFWRAWQGEAFFRIAREADLEFERGLKAST